MAKDPAVLFYTSDFLSGTLTMSNEHIGMYIKLLCLQHQKGRLTDKDMLYICSTYVEDVYSKFIKDEHGKYYNERMEIESLKRKNYSKSRRENVLKRYSQSTEDSTYVVHMENENENINEDKALISTNNKIVNNSINKIENHGRFSQPTTEEIKAYCIERKNRIDPERFFDFYQSKGWMVGKNKMKDWRAAVRNAEKGDWCLLKPKRREDEKPIEYKNDPVQQKAVSKMISKTVKSFKRIN
jgi:preprotein translocase subunit Sec63